MRSCQLVVVDLYQLGFFIRRVFNSGLCSRADYWKSQAKKFCDFCKCWIADNKPSVGFHESGKRHKENVAKRLAEIGKNSAKSQQEAKQVDLDMKKMEEEALKAYMKDLQENPDYTSQRILEETEKRKKELEDSVRKQKEEKTEKEVPEVPKTVADKPTEKLWFEAKSDEGYTYYWNVNTSESVWEPPAEGFVSIEEQEKEAKIKEDMKKRKKEEKAKRKEEELKALKEKEDTKKKKKKKVEDNTKEEATSAMGPAPKPDPYGGWTVIEPKVEEPLDLELPQQEFVAIKVPELSEPEVKFKEKTIGSLETDETRYHGFVKREQDQQVSAEGFKKRKFNRGNTRQKLDTD